MRRKLAGSVLMYVVGARLDARGRRFPARPVATGPRPSRLLFDVVAALEVTGVEGWRGAASDATRTESQVSPVVGGGAGMAGANQLPPLPVLAEHGKSARRDDEEDGEEAVAAGE
jgi:hypothetical protein